MIEMYLDGELNGLTQDQSIYSLMSESNIILGNRSTTNSLRPYKGSMDEIRFYNRTLTLEEIELMDGSTELHKIVKR